jgi:hypothetical protein
VQEGPQLLLPPLHPRVLLPGGLLMQQHSCLLQAFLPLALQLPS